MKFTSITIGTRINFTKDDEEMLSQAKDPIKLLIKLCDQLVSGYVSTLSSPSTKDIEIRILQWKIDGVIEIRWRLETMYKKKTDE